MSYGSRARGEKVLQCHLRCVVKKNREREIALCMSLNGDALKSLYFKTCVTKFVKCKKKKKIPKDSFITFKIFG